MSLILEFFKKMNFNQTKKKQPGHSSYSKEQHNGNFTHNSYCEQGKLRQFIFCQLHHN